MSLTPHLGLPLIAAAQAQKHVTHNEALFGLDALVQLAVLDRDLTTPPASPSEGDRYIVAGSGVGAWAGKGGQIAAWRDGLWRFYAPSRGWLAYVLDDGALLAWNGTGWAGALTTISEFQNLSRLGLGTTADAGNPFAAKLNDALWAAKGVGEGGTGDLRLKLNKESAAKVLSLLLQSGWSGRAELGLAGDDDFRIKVSADGGTWTEALRINRATGIASFPAGAIVPGGNRNLIINPGFGINQRNYASGTALAAGLYAHDRWKAGAGGCTYTVPASGADATITITAGSLMQAIEGRSVEGGAYTLSWTGTAQARIGVNGANPSGAYAGGPITIGSAPAGQPVTVEFTGGTLGRVQLEPGPIATPFVRRLVGIETMLCQRYCCVMTHNWVVPAVGQLGYGFRFPVDMRATPTAVNVAPGTATSATVVTEAAQSNTGGYAQASATAVNGSILNRVTRYDAEL